MQLQLTYIINSLFNLSANQLTEKDQTLTMLLLKRMTIKSLYCPPTTLNKYFELKINPVTENNCFMEKLTATSNKTFVLAS